MARTSSIRWVPALLLFIFDVAILGASAVAATWIRFLSEYFAQELTALAAHPGFLLYAVLAQFALATTFDLYRPAAWRTRGLLLIRVLALSITLPVALTLGVYLVSPWRFGRGLLVLTLLFALPAQLMVRLLWQAWGVRQVGRTATLLGDGPIVQALLSEIEKRPWPPFRITDHVLASELQVPDEDLQERLADAELLVVAGLANPEITRRVAALNFRGIAVVDAAGAYADLTGRIPVQQVDAGWFIATGDFSNLADTPFHHLQRMFDVVAAAALLVLSLPVLLTAGLLVLLTGGFPVFFRQVRLGRYCRPFTLVKLRTMRRSADREGPKFTAEGDERLLPMAAFLRRWRIDEIPQLLNVLKGDMSLVGPRPERPEITTELEKKIPFFAFRYSVRPGLTGWAQVNHPYCSDLEDHRVKLEYDLYSLRHHGPALYVLVLIHTLGALIFRPGR